MHLSEFDDAYDDLELIRGAILTTPIRNLHLQSPVLVNVGDTVEHAVATMNAHHTGYVLVEKDGKLVGIFTERDVLTRAFQSDQRNMSVALVMTPEPETIDSSATIAYALNRMSVGGYRHIPIVDRIGSPFGVVSIRDLVDFLVELFPTNVINLPDRPDMAIPRTVDGG